MHIALRLLALALALPMASLHAQDKPKDGAAETLSAVVRVKARVLPNARSAEALGMVREGNGVLIRENFVLTIGYLVIEAEGIEVIAGDGKAVPATLAGYDHSSGFGLLRLVAPIDARPLPLGDPKDLAERDPVMVATYGGREGLSLAYVVSRRPFSGSWEYMLDSAIFTYPPVTNWSGAALIGSLISNRYISNVQSMLVAKHSIEWVSWLNDPQILFSHDRIAKFLEAMPRAKHEVVILLAGAQNALVDAIHDSQWLIAVFIVLAFWLAHRIPVINIHLQAKDRELVKRH